MKALTITERETAITQFASDTFPHCDAYESGCNCDLCRDDDRFVVLHSVEANHGNV